MVRKLYWGIGIIVIIVVIVTVLLLIYSTCPAIVIICPDGTSTRVCWNDASCPELQFCDASAPCPEGMNCYIFPDDERPYCYVGDPCQKCYFRGCQECNILESFPEQVQCTVCRMPN